MKKVKRIIYKIVVDSIFIPIYYLVYKKQYEQLKIKTIHETIDAVVDDHKSMSRYGDGEFKCMDMVGQDYKKGNAAMNERLKKILFSECEDLIVCLPQAFRDPKYLKANLYWERIMGQYGHSWLSYCDKQKQYYNTSVARPYIDLKDKEVSRYVFSKFKDYIKNKNLLVVEGINTKFGIGNDLFEGVKSVDRIECPAENAFDNYDDILNEVKDKIKAKNYDLVLAAVGPTATILAYDITNDDDTNVQILDIGHLDVEYSWLVEGAVRRVAIDGKEVNEAKE